jgi:hypothetical protein
MDLLAYAIRIVKAVPQVMQYLSLETIKALGGYEQVRNSYWATVYDAVEGYLTGNRPVTSFRNSMYNAMNSAFQTAAELGYVDAGGEVPLDANTQAWIDGMILSEKENINSLFGNLQKNWESKDAINEAFARAEGYAWTLDSIYGTGKMYGSKNITLEFGGDDGNESCPDCQQMKGKRHKISWILENNMRPAPGNSNYECNGYNCNHFWFDPKTGEEYKF